MSKSNYLGVLVAVIACSVNGDHEKASFDLAESRGRIENPLIAEASGMVEGINNAGLLWTHNDSGNDPMIFLLDDFGRHKGSFTLDVVNRDWEDITSGPGPVAGMNYLYVGDLGDNNAVYEHKYIYRFEEPLAGSTEQIKVFDTITLQYPDGNRDAECLMVDPLTKDLYIISKREAQVGIYRAAYPQPTTKLLILEKLGTIPFNNIVAGDISSDGNAILLKTYDKILYWERQGSIVESLQKPPLEIPYDPEPQGESIAWKKDLTGFYTLSEERHNIEAVLYFYRKK